MNYGKTVSNAINNGPVSQPIIGRPEMVKNSTEGFVFNTTSEAALERFLILGTEGGTYYASESRATVDAAKNVIEMAVAGNVDVVSTIIKVATARPSRAPKMEPSLFALAVCTAKGTPEVKAKALSALSAVCRIPTHLFTFLQAHKDLGGKTGGRSFQRALQNWYLEKDPSKLAYQVVKYQGRNGWTHRDVLRLARPKAQTPEQNSILSWAVNGSLPLAVSSEAGAYLVAANELLRGEPTKQRAINLIESHGFTHEMVPTKLQKDPDIWAALLPRMPINAMVRNLGRMTANGLIVPFSATTQSVVEKLENVDALRKSRIHPLNVYVALRTYQQGKGTRGSLTWRPDAQILSALEGAFYNAFGNVEPTGKRFMVGLDVSGSMGGFYGYGYNSTVNQTGLMGIPGFTPYEAETLMSLLVAKTEKQTFFGGFSDNFTPLAINSRDNMSSALQKIRSLRMGSTRIAAPMEYATKNRIPVDCFQIYTDNEVNMGGHPCQTLEKYRQATGINAAMVVCAMTSTNFTVADPKDPKQLDVVGFDTAVPALIRQLLV